MILDTFLVIPAYVPVQEADKFFQRDTRPVSAIEHFVFDTPEEAFTRSIIRRASFARHGPYKSGGVDTLEPARPPVMATTIAVYQLVYHVR